MHGAGGPPAVIKYPVLLSRPSFRFQDLDKMNSSALESRDHDLEITTLGTAIWDYSNFFNSKNRATSAVSVEVCALLSVILLQPH